MRIAIEKPCGLEKREEHQSVEHQRAIEVAFSLSYISLNMGQESCTLYFETLIELFRILVSSATHTIFDIVVDNKIHLFITKTVVPSSTLCGTPPTRSPIPPFALLDQA